MVRGTTLALVLVAGVLGKAHAGPLVPSKASDVVNAFPTGVACPVGDGRLIDTRLLGDGTTTPLVVPAGQVLVVTGASFIVDPDPMSFVLVGLTYGNSGYEAFGTSIECGTLGPP